MEFSEKCVAKHLSGCYCKPSPTSKDESKTKVDIEDIEDKDSDSELEILILKVIMRKKGINICKIKAVAQRYSAKKLLWSCR